MKRLLATIALTSALTAPIALGASTANAYSNCHETFNYNLPQWVAGECDSGSGNYREVVKCTAGGGIYVYAYGQIVSVGHWSLAQCPSSKPYQVWHAISPA